MWWSNFFVSRFGKGVPKTLVLALFLSGCGFSPLFLAAQNQGGHVLLHHPPNPASLLFAEAWEQQHIIRLRTNKSLVLNVVVTEEERASLLLRTARVTRRDYIMRVRYVLKDQDLALTRGAVQESTSYNQVASPYANLQSQRTARQEAARAAARSVYNHLTTFFNFPHGNAQRSP